MVNFNALFVIGGEIKMNKHKKILGNICLLPFFKIKTKLSFIMIVLTFPIKFANKFKLNSNLCIQFRILQDLSDAVKKKEDFLCMSKIDI